MSCIASGLEVAPVIGGSDDDVRVDPAAYQAGWRAFEAGQGRNDGPSLGFHGDQEKFWQVGWDDADEATADKTEAVIDLPAVSERRAA